jgi:hypothetical protein
LCCIDRLNRQPKADIRAPVLLRCGAGHLLTLSDVEIGIGVSVMIVHS